MKAAYVYEHWRPDTQQPFWVGKGTRGRYLVFRRRRNPHYTAVIAKLDQLGLKPEARIVADNLTDQEAFALEIERIAHWKNEGVRLCNWASGGHGGMSGVVRSEESRAKQSATMTGRKLSPDHRKKIIDRVSSPESRSRNSALHKGRKRPDGTGEKISTTNKEIYADPIRGPRRREAVRKALVGRKTSEATKAKQRAAKTPEIRARLSAAAKKQWDNPAFRSLVSATMRRTNEKRAAR